MEKFRFNFLHEHLGNILVLCEENNAYLAIFEAWYSVARLALANPQSFEEELKFEDFVENLHMADRSNTIDAMDLANWCGYSIKMNGFEEISSVEFASDMKKALSKEYPNYIYRPFEN